MSQNFQKHDEFMNYSQDMDIHVEIHEELSQNARICTCMHDTSSLFHILSHNLALDTNIPLHHARTNSIHKQEGISSTLSLQVQEGKPNFAIILQFL